MQKFSPILLALLLSAAPLLAQTAQKRTSRPASASDHKLVRIKITGTKRYTPEQMLAFSNLHIGDNVSEENLKEVSQRLGETGLFTGVAYNFTFSPSGTEVDFQLTDTSELVPAEFENFVWFTDDELRRKLRDTVPLFEGEVPLDGSLIDTVGDALQAFLAYRNVEGARVEIMRHGEGAALDSVVYSVSGVNIHIQDFEFPGAGDAERQRLQDAARHEQGEEYQRSNMRLLSKMDLMPIYLREGKLKAEFGEPQAKLVKEEKQEVLVNVVIPVEEGRQYTLGKIEWSGNKLFPADKLASAIRLKPGQVVDDIRLKADFDKVNEIYRTKGYINASVVPELALDDAAATANYKLEVKEGDQYKMGELELAGLDEKTKVRAQEAWTLREGEPYDGSYAKRGYMAALKDIFPPNVDWKMSVRESVNESDKTVDVTIYFTIDVGR